MIKLYIDDIREPKNEGFIIVRSFEEAVNYMKENGIPEYISFDHDLGIKENGKLEKTGLDIAKWIINQDLNGDLVIPENFEFNVHSANPVGANNIKDLLNCYLEFKSKI